MFIDNYFTDRLIFDVVYRKADQTHGVVKFIFAIDETEMTVKETLTSAPYHIDVIDVIEHGYALKQK